MLDMNPLAGKVFARLTGSIDGAAAIPDDSFLASERVPKKGDHDVASVRSDHCQKPLD